MNLAKSATSTLILSLMLLFVIGSIPVKAQVDEAPTRDQIEDKYKWNLTDFSASDQVWNDDYDQVIKDIPTITEFKGKLGMSADSLLKALDMVESIGNTVHRLYVYANLKLDEDNRVSKYQEMSSKAQLAYSEMGQATAYMQPEILQIPQDKIHKWMDNNKDLAVYRHHIDDMFRRQAHVLSEKEERILALAGPLAAGPKKIFTMTDDADIKFGTTIDDDGKEIELTRGRYNLLLQSKDREVRRRASNTYNNAFTGYINTLGATLATSIARDWFFAQARDYQSCLNMAMDDNNIPTSVFYNIIKSANNNLAPLHKYTALRKKFLGVDTLFGFDMYVPLVENVKTKYDYELAKNIVLKSLAPLGDGYLKNVEMAYNSRWIDVYETKGKSSGGFSWGTYTVHPVIMLNWANSLDNVFTLSHEMGHTMHSYYTNENEPSVYSGHSTFAAEVASTCNEALTINYMLEHAKDKNEKLYILDYYINMFIGTFFVQLFFSEFELEAHETVEKGDALSSDGMRKMYRDIYQKYYGPDYFIPEGRDIGCLRISHFYREYYVYQYATSFAASQMLSKMLLDKKPGAREAYINFIKTGVSEYPIQILQKAGIDFTTTEPFDYTMKIFSDLVDQYEKLLLSN
jgi:oligoendopeptidase F